MLGITKNMFALTTKNKKRNGVITTPHGTIPTPAFMPIATRGVVKHLEPAELHAMGADVILSNTYHLFQRPGLEVLKKHGGLHNFMGWHGPILTDSGGYQVFSLAKMRKITPNGATFTSELDGSRVTLTPEKVIDIQMVIGSDILMVLDECPPWPATYEYAKKSLDLTLAWAARSKTHFEKMIQRKKIPPHKRPLLFGIVQGSTYKDLRRASACALRSIGFDGYAIGGLAVGEGAAERKKALRWSIEELPTDKPRYLMGVGKPHDIVGAVDMGVDLFDCVIPSREARHGRIYTAKKIFNIRSKTFEYDLRPLSAGCLCTACKLFTRSYIRHLFSIGEAFGARLATIHNLRFYLDLMRSLRA